jgi:2-polyprenyl-6-methoxyphenol hydroxylase-like FAD-dependent oxidoreductase
MLPASTPLLVVGAGPTGLALAVELARRGCPATVVDRLAAGGNTSRAAVIHLRTLEVLEPLGVVPELRARAVEVPVFRFRDRDRALMEVGFTGLPGRYQNLLMIPQSETEAVLEARLVALGGTVHRGMEVIELEPAGEGVDVTLSGPGGKERIRAARVAGCDGLHSVVRAAAGIGFPGESYPQSFVLADVVMDWPPGAGEVSLSFAADGLVVVAPLPGGRMRIVATLDEAPAEPSAADVQALLDARGPGGARVHEVVWGSRFRVQHRVADGFVRGPFLILGDAAHVHSPAGGQGMNLGLKDAVTLAGALAAGADLDGWARTRRAEAAEVVRMTDRLTRIATLRSPAARQLRNLGLRLLGSLPPVRRRLALRFSGLDRRDGA